MALKDRPRQETYTQPTVYPPIVRYPNRMQAPHVRRAEHKTGEFHPLIKLAIAVGTIGAILALAHMASQVVTSR